MAQIYLVRHGQAAFGTDDYDRLSSLGHRQARWLGEHFGERGIRFDRVVTGRLRRHAETAAGICAGLDAALPLEQLDGLDEYDFMALCGHYLRQHPERALGDDPDRRAAMRLLRDTLHAWSRDELDGELPESWTAFHDRVAGALEGVRNGSEPGRRLLVVSSGGPISMAIGQVMGLAPAATVSLNLQVRNASISELTSSRGSLAMHSFNNVPHLDRPDRPEAVTYF